MRDFFQYGFNLVENFISEKEEDWIVSQIQKDMGKGEKNPLNFGTKRRSFDLDVIFTPPYIDELCERIFSYRLLDSKPNSMTVIKMPKNKSIGRHIDSVENGPVITVLNMKSVANVRLQKEPDVPRDIQDRRPLGEDSPYSDEFVVTVNPRALYQMRGEVRELWSHTILPVDNIRYSIVFRCIDSDLNVKRPLLIL